MATELLYNFFTKSQQDAVNAVTAPAIEKMTEMDLFIRRAHLLAKENAIAHTQRPTEYHTYINKLGDRTANIVELGNLPGLNKTMFKGAKSAEHIREACDAAAHGLLSHIEGLIRDHYHNARISQYYRDLGERNHGLTGIKRALLDGIPSYALERAAFLYKELDRFYKHHTARMKPEQEFLVEFGGSVNIREQLRQRAKNQKMPVFYGMATEPVLTATMRRVLGVDYLGDYEPEQFLDPVQVWSGSSPGYLLGLLWTYGAKNMTGHSCDIVGYPRNSINDRLTFEDFEMDLNRIPVDHGVAWFVTLSIGGGPTMLFFIDQHTAMQMGSVQFF